MEPKTTRDSQGESAGITFAVLMLFVVAMVFLVGLEFGRVTAPQLPIIDSIQSCLTQWNGMWVLDPRVCEITHLPAQPATSRVSDTGCPTGLGTKRPDGVVECQPSDWWNYDSYYCYAQQKWYSVKMNQKLTVAHDDNCVLLNPKNIDQIRAAQNIQLATSTTFDRTINCDNHACETPPVQPTSTTRTWSCPLVDFVEVGPNSQVSGSPVIVIARNAPYSDCTLQTSTSQR